MNAKAILNHAFVYDTGKIGDDIASASLLQSQAISLTVIATCAHALVHAGFAWALWLSAACMLGLTYLAYKAYKHNTDIKGERNE